MLFRSEKQSMPNINIFCQWRFNQTSARQPTFFGPSSSGNPLSRPLLSSLSEGEDSSSSVSSSPQGLPYKAPNPRNIGTEGSSSSRQPVVIQQPLPTQTTPPQNGKSYSQTSDKLAEILNILENASPDPNAITASITEISKLGVHNKPTSIRFLTKIGNNNSQQYNLAYPTSSDIANHQLVLLNKIVTKLIEIKNKNEELKPDVVDCLLNLRKCIDTHDTLDKIGSNNNQQQVRSEIRKKIKDDEEVSKRYREIVMEAVKQSGSALRYASEELRGDSCFVKIGRAHV